MRRWLIAALGGFPDLDAAIEHIRKTDSDEKREILRLAVKRLFLPIDPDDILRMEHGDWFFLGKPLTQETMQRLRQEAEALKTMKLWQILKHDVRYQLSRQMYENGRVPDDFLWGQLATWLWDIMKTRIEEIRSLK